MIQQLLIKPIITEKSISQTKKGFYTFAVNNFSRKGEIKKTIEDQFNVDVLAIRTIRMPGKTHRSGKTMKKVYLPSWKKAIVKLAKDQKITLFEVGS